ncbi:hypothetical protein BGW41_007266 [Actinomortierella wolfii]|nr:hypothetical protein BGW41_007266 [Actinomortierella wolfii]
MAVGGEATTCRRLHITVAALQGGALTIDATSPALTDTDNTVFLPDNGSDAHHGCCKDPLTTNSFALSSLTEKVSRRILELIDPSTSHLDSDGGDQEKQQLQLEAWTLNHDLVWPDGDYFKATKISMRQGVAQLKRGRRYVFVEPVLGPASSYLYPNPLSHTQQLLGSEEELDNVDDAVSGTELSMSYSQESQEQSEQELYNRQGNDEAEAEAAPKITSGRRESMLPSSMSQVSSGTSMSAQEAGSCHSEGVKAEKEEEEPYSPLLDPTVDGQDQFEYGLYELTYIGRIDQLSPKDFVPVRGRSFLVRLDENRPTLASPVPASSRAPECRCQLMMRKMVMQRELLQVRPAIAPVLTRAERQALREREAMLAQLQLRLQMRAQRAHAAGSGISGEGGYNRSRSNDRNTRIIRRPSLERSASEWYRHYGSGQPPSPRHQHHHHRQHRRGHHLHGRRHSTSSSTSLMSSSEASMPSICSTSELSAAIDSLSIDHDNGTSNHSSLSEEPSADGTQDTLMENSAMSGKGVDVVEEGAQSDASETDSLDESHWPGWRLYHRHHHDGYLPDDGRTRWVDHRRFEMTMTEIEQLERERDDEETEEYEEEEASVGNRYLNDYFGYADAGHRVASRTAHGSSRRRYVSPPPPLRTSSPPPEDSRSHPFLHHHHHSATSTSPATSYGPVTSSGEGDLSEYLTATTTMPFNQDYSDDGTSDATSSALASDESELDEDECELPMPAYLCPQQHHRHHHPWRIPFLGQSSLMPLSRLEENDADEENEDEYEYEDDDDNDTNEAAMRRGRRAQCCPSLPPPLLSPSLAPSFTSTLVQQRHRGMMYASDLDYSEDEDGEGDDEFEECLEEEKEEEVEETEKEYVEQQQQQQQQQYEEQPDELEARDFGPPSEMRRDRESAMYSYQMPNYQQQFRPRPVEDEAWWDPSPPEPSLLQASLQHRRTFVHPATNGARNHQHQHHHRPPRSAHSILGWTLEPISARA